MKASSFRLGPWLVEPIANRISQGDEVVNLEPLAMELLVYLAERAGEVAGTEELMAAVWRDRVVGDNSLYQIVAHLRKALRDNTRRPRFIATIPKRGYSLIAAVEPVTAKPAASAVAETRPLAVTGRAQAGQDTGEQERFAVKRSELFPLWRKAAILAAILLAGLIVSRILPSGYKSEVADPASDIDSIAVLPFKNLDDDDDDDYFADGMAAELITALSRIESLKVVARTSSFAFRTEPVDIRTIGRKLNVESVLEGAVRKDDNRVRVTAQLVDTSTGYNLWSGVYDRELSDIFTIQEDIADNIIKAVAVRVNAQTQTKMTDFGTNDFEAYDYFLLGIYKLFQRTDASLREANKRFQQAIELDSDYARAYTGIAASYLLLNTYGDSTLEESLRQAQPAVQKALDLAPRDAAVQAALGLFHLYRNDYTIAETAFKQAIELLPNFSLAYMWTGLALRNQGRVGDAQVFFQEAQALDPLNVTANMNLGYNLGHMGRFEQGYKHLLSMSESKVSEAQLYRALANLSIDYGRYDLALYWAGQALQINADGALSAAILALAHSTLGDFAKAGVWIDRARDLAPANPVVLQQQELIYLGSGEFAAFDAFAQQQLAEAPASTSLEMNWRWARAGVAKLLLRDYSQAADYLAQAFEDGEMIIEERDFDPYYCTALAYSQQQTGAIKPSENTMERCRGLIQQLRAGGWDTPLLGYGEARLQALQGQTEPAIATLREAVARGFKAYWLLLHDPVLDSLRDYSDFKQLMAALAAEIQVLVQQAAENEGQAAPLTAR